MRPARRRLYIAVKTVLTVVVLGAVGWHFVKLLSNPAVQERLTLRPEYLVPAGLLYLVCHTVWGTFWVQLLHGQGVRIGWLAGVRAYFVSQFGKYVPGKAWVILLRVGLLRKAGVSSTVVIVTGLYETLTNMAAGAVLGTCLLPWSGVTDELSAAQRYAIIGLAFVPVVLLVLNQLVRRVAAKYRRPGATPIPVPSVWLLARGLLQAMVGWTLLGVSAWLVACGLAVDPPPLTPATFAQYLCAMCVSYVIGFAVLFLPAGGGARELVLQQMLAPALGEVSAAVAVVLRLVWTLFEAVAAVGLWLFARPVEPADAVPQGEREAGLEVSA